MSPTLKPISSAAVEDTDIVEVTIRRFYTCDEADLTPSVSIVGAASEIAKVHDWNKVIVAQAAIADSQIKGAPIENVRSMTADEIRAFREQEAEEG